MCESDSIEIKQCPCCGTAIVPVKAVKAGDKITIDVDGNLTPISDNVNVMIELIKEIEWYYQNRKSHILPIVYEDMLKDAVHYASQNMWEDASVWINGLRKAREETE